MRFRHALAAVVTSMVLTRLVACGGTSTETTSSSKAAWMAAHGDAVANLNHDLEAARTTLSSLQRSDILGNCNQLRDSLGEARKGLPVPDADVDAALRTALDAVSEGTEDCVQGARGPNIPQLEKSFRELREASTLMDVANKRLEAWT